MGHTLRVLSLRRFIPSRCGSQCLARSTASDLLDRDFGSRCVLIDAHFLEGGQSSRAGDMLFSRVLHLFRLTFVRVFTHNVVVGLPKGHLMLVLVSRV